MNRFLHEKGQPQEQGFCRLWHWGTGEMVQIMSSSCLKLSSQLGFEGARGKPFILKSGIVDRRLRSSDDDPSGIQEDR